MEEKDKVGLEPDEVSIEDLLDEEYLAVEQKIGRILQKKSEREKVEKITDIYRSKLDSNFEKAVQLYIEYPEYIETDIDMDVLDIYYRNVRGRNSDPLELLRTAKTLKEVDGFFGLTEETDYQNMYDEAMVEASKGIGKMENSYLVVDVVAENVNREYSDNRELIRRYEQVNGYSFDDVRSFEKIDENVEKFPDCMVLTFKQLVEVGERKDSPYPYAAVAKIFDDLEEFMEMEIKSYIKDTSSYSKLEDIVESDSFSEMYDDAVKGALDKMPETRSKYQEKRKEFLEDYGFRLPDFDTYLTKFLDEEKLERELLPPMKGRFSPYGLG